MMRKQHACNGQPKVLVVGLQQHPLAPITKNWWCLAAAARFSASTLSASNSSIAPAGIAGPS